jgi:hypothetical protein
MVQCLRLGGQVCLNVHDNGLSLQLFPVAISVQARANFSHSSYYGIRTAVLWLLNDFASLLNSPLSCGAIAANHVGQKRNIS